MKKFAALLLLSMFPLISAMAQTQSMSAPPEMKKLDFLVGQWKGEGWMELRPGQRQTATVNESVQRKAEGTVLLIEGLGTTKMPDKPEEVPVHKAFAIVDYDVGTKLFRLRAYRAGAGAIDTNPKVEENSLVWGFKDARGGEVRFTIKLNEKGQWFEIGEYSGDGKTWRKFLEMTLNRLS
jgi:hypothetical protein